uniref:Uncharacterized protein n=1 Tax=Timema monikensis TaxID=170555 RepID=A0A7R9DZW6_9NEOP|nr:unnamed protein product [Timema monikensis]
MPTATLVDLVTSVPRGENVDEENIEEWLECDSSEPGFEQLTDVEITNKAMGVNENEEEQRESEEDTRNCFAARRRIASIFRGTKRRRTSGRKTHVKESCERARGKTFPNHFGASGTLLVLIPIRSMFVKPNVSRIHVECDRSGVHYTCNLQLHSNVILPVSRSCQWSLPIGFVSQSLNKVLPTVIYET